MTETIKATIKNRKIKITAACQAEAVDVLEAIENELKRNPEASLSSIIAKELSIFSEDLGYDYLSVTVLPLR